MTGRIAAILVLTSMIATACVQPGRGAESPSSGGAVSQSRTLKVVIKNEPFDLTDTASSRNNFTVAAFGATLTRQDNGETYALLSAVPDLNTDTWRVFPDGTMETTYRLKPGLTWHDGQPLTAEDFVFTQRLNTARSQMGLSVSSINPAEHRVIQEILAPAPDTVVIRWRRLYADAARPTLKVVPKNILEEPLNTGESQLIGSHAYWTTGYVGVGPYKLTKWEQGAFLEGTAFDGYALGRPKIDKIVISFNTDPNVVLAGLLAGSANVAVDTSVQFEQGAILKDEWSKTGGGKVILTPSENRYLGGQFRPEYVQPKALLDVRVRAATLHAIDRKAMADALLSGEGIISDTPLVPADPLFTAVDKVITKYPLDLRRTDELMRQAGFTKGTDGFYANSDGPFTFGVWGIAEGQEGRETTAAASLLRGAGFDAQLQLFPSVQMQGSDELKSTYPAWRNNYGVSPNRLLGYNVSTAENRWGGTNKFGWANPEFDRIFDTWNTTLGDKERDQLNLQIWKIISDDLPVLPLYYNLAPLPHTSDLEGPEGSKPGTSTFGNVHEWRWIR